VSSPGAWALKCLGTLSFTHTDKIDSLYTFRYYTWGPQRYVDNASALEFVPMLWGTKQIHSFQKTIDDNILTLNITTVVGMNE